MKPKGGINWNIYGDHLDGMMKNIIKRMTLHARRHLVEDSLIVDLMDKILDLLERHDMPVQELARELEIQEKELCDMLWMRAEMSLRMLIRIFTLFGYELNFSLTEREWLKENKNGSE